MPHSKISRDWIKIFVGPDPCHEEEGPGPKGVLCPIQKYPGIAYLPAATFHSRLGCGEYKNLTTLAMFCL